MTMHTHRCIKPGCSNTYQDSDPDAYYCASCNEAWKAIAKEIDAKVRPHKATKSDLQTFDELRKAKGVNFVNIKDLGISL